MANHGFPYQTDRSTLLARQYPMARFHCEYGTAKGGQTRRAGICVVNSGLQRDARNSIAIKTRRALNQSGLLPPEGHVLLLLLCGVTRREVTVANSGREMRTDEEQATEHELPSRQCSTFLRAKLQL